MTQYEKKTLAEAAIPLEVLCAQIAQKPYGEMTLVFQNQILQSMVKIRALLFGQNNEDHP